MTEKELKDSIKSPSGGYFFYGEEDYLKEFYTMQIRSAIIADEELAPFNEYVFDSDSFNAAALEDALYAPPMMAEKKLVRARLASYSAIPEKEKKALITLFASLKELPDTVLVISVAPEGFDAGTEKKPTAAFKNIRDHLACVDFPLNTEAKLVRWIARHFAKGGLTADEDSMKLMISLCGRSMHRLLGEAEKVIARSHAMGITHVDGRLIADTVTITPEEGAFELANAILAGDAYTALECLGRAKRRNEPPIKLLGSVTSTLCELASVAHMAEEGEDKRTISQTLGIFEFKVGMYMRASAGLDTEILAKIVAMCGEADLKMKTSSLGYVPLERLICAACSERRGDRV